MSIYFGNDTVNDLYIGLTPVSKGYVGTHLFYNGDNTIIDFTYEKYILNTQFSTLYNTTEKPIKSAVLKGNTKYRDIDTGNILDTFDETKNLELVSVKMPVLKTVGKNLCGGLEQGDIASSDGSLTEASNRLRTKDFITIYPGSYSVSVNTGYELTYRIYDMNEVFLFAPTSWKQGDKITVTENGKLKLVVKETNNGGVLPTDDIRLQVEIGSGITTYEPYKSNILTVNDEVELRGISKIKDELNLLTGELTQRINEVVLDGSEDWVLSSMSSSSIFYTTLNNLVHTTVYLDSIKCDKFKTYISEGNLNNSTDLNGISGYGDTYNSYPNDNWLYIKHADSEGSVEKFKQWLSQNPVTVQYQLTTESIKTIDISTVDQGGNDTELKTFDDITHVTLSSEGLIPEAELEVATKNEEVLNTMSLEMDDISATQAALEETSNTQSENVDATMMATTEIYEQIL